MNELIKRLLHEGLQQKLPKELIGKRIVSNIGFGIDREYTVGIVNLKDLKVLDNGIKAAINTYATNQKFKSSNKPIIVGVDINTGEKQLLDGYHRYISRNGMGNFKAFFIPMENGDIISFNAIDLNV